MLVVTPSLSIPLTEFRFEHARSSGAGGQNVNKVNTKVILRWTVASSPSLSIEIRERFLQLFHRRINTLGELRIASDRFRSQSRNAEDCLMRLTEMLLSVAEAPKPRRATRVSQSQKRRRLEAKRRQSIKKFHRTVQGDD